VLCLVATAEVLSPGDKRVGEALDWLRVARGLVIAVGIVVMLPVVLLLMSEAQRRFEGRLLILGAVVVFGAVMWDLVRTLRAHRRQSSGLPASEMPGKDGIWDQVADAGRVYTGVRTTGFPLAQRTSGTALTDSVVHATGAVLLDPARADVYRAAQSAAIAVGLSQPPTLYVAREAGANAAAVGSPEGWGVVVGGAMLDAFTESELLGVFAALGARVAEQVTDSVPGRVGSEGFMWPSERMEPPQVLKLYQASDARAVLALRDAMSVAGALGKTAPRDPYFPGLTVDQAQLMWTWPSSASPLVATTGDEVAEWLIGLALSGAGPLTRRLELVRLDALEAGGAITNEERLAAEAGGQTTD